MGLDKDINCYRFLIFNFDLEYLKRLQSSEPLHAKSLLLLEHTVGKESFLHIGWHSFLLWKIRQSVALFWFGLRVVGFLLTSRPPKNNCWLLRMFGARLGGQDCGLCPYNRSAEEEGGLDGFLYEVAQNFEDFSNIQG
jgi:hypothetical protein